MIKFAAQLFFVVAISVGGFALFGHATYMTIGGVIAVAVLALFMTRSHWASDSRVPPDPGEDELPTVALEFFYRFVLSLLLGVFWPSLPFIVGYGRAKDGGGSSPKTADPTQQPPR